MRYSDRLRSGACAILAALSCGLVTIFGNPALAQAAPKVVSEGAYAPEGEHQLVLHSTRLGHDVRVVISAPSNEIINMGKRSANQKLPAIYALDSGYGIAGPLAQMMGFVSAMSPAYVVSIGYPDKVDYRNTDLLFRKVTENGETFGGGGAAFKAFLTDELRPFLETRYPLDPSKAILFGHSFGGLFTANVVADTPEAFSGYIIASPSVPRDPDVVARLRAAAAAGKGRRVFVAVGEKEPTAMVDGAGRIASALSATGSTFKVESKVFAGSGHVSYYSLLVPTAFAWILPPDVKDARVAIPVSPSALDRLVGSYALVDGRLTTITRKDNKLYAQITGLPGNTELLAESPQSFFIAGFDIVMTFELPATGPANALTTRMNGTELRAVRTP